MSLIKNIFEIVTAMENQQPCSIETSVISKNKITTDNLPIEYAHLINDMFNVIAYSLSSASMIEPGEPLLPFDIIEIQNKLNNITI